MKLGRRPAIKKPSLKLADIRTGAIPEIPPTADHLANVPNFEVYGNDRWGVCGPVSVANQLKLVTRYLAGQQLDVSQEQVFELYRQSGNPNFDPMTGADDNGVYMQVMLEALVKHGIAGVKPVAFAEVDVDNPEELRAAVAIFGSTLDGMMLREAQQEQLANGLWEYDPNSPLWGGHAVVSGRYDGNSIDCITWGEDVDRTDEFLAHQLEEAWVVIWPWNLGTQQFWEGISLPALASAYKELTGKTLVVPVEPPVGPPIDPPAPVVPPDEPGINGHGWVVIMAGIAATAIAFGAAHLLGLW